jgi:hypothetical protein
MTEAVSTSETSVSFYQTTRRNVLEHSRLQAYEYLNSINIINIRMKDWRIMLLEGKRKS